MSESFPLKFRSASKVPFISMLSPKGYTSLIIPRFKTPLAPASKLRSLIGVETFAETEKGLLAIENPNEASTLVKSRSPCGWVTPTFKVISSIVLGKPAYAILPLLTSNDTLKSGI